MTDKDPVEASALAGSAIAIALLDLLLQKNVITRDEALIILKEAQGVLKNSSTQSRELG